MRGLVVPAGLLLPTLSLKISKAISFTAQVNMCRGQEWQGWAIRLALEVLASKVWPQAPAVTLAVSAAAETRADLSNCALE